MEADGPKGPLTGGEGIPGGSIPGADGGPYIPPKALAFARPIGEAGGGGISSDGVKALTQALPEVSSGAAIPGPVGCGACGGWGI